MSEALVPACRRAVLGCVLIAALGLAGCGSKDATVSGRVKFDGQPIQTGSIAFVPVDGKTPSAEGVIRDGKYSLPMLPGEKRVQILATKVVGKWQVYQGDPNSPMADKTEQYIPVQYNQGGKLTASVKPGSNKFDFDLPAKP